ncbi:hydantoinase/oxoprolinase family protein [Stella sp.]|uniref:hydantoinase/oxoprolinase family protein n=1 Tax=Stella sp. TaxID=2912054 RepID=UPI0035AE67B2
MYRIGVDIGGTFTDFALFDAAGGRMAIHKQLTTPRDPSAAVLDGVATMLAANGVAIDRVHDIVHGTTLVTNAVIERRGAVTGMLVTAGFRDILDMGYESRYDLYDLRLRFPPPIVPRRLRAEIDERMRPDGKVERRLDRASVRAAVAGLKDQGIEALAVCLLHSYANPAHEQAVAKLVAKEFPDLYVSTSADVFPNMREFERWTTTTVNAFTQPMFDRYLRRLEDGLAGQGFRGRVYIMTSSGGTVTTETARRYPVRALESGPAAGALMSAHHGRSLALDEVLAFDMGGTTAKGALIRNGQPLKKYMMEVARVHEFKRGSGLPVRIPVIDMIEIGAGGGSLAGVDERGLLRVGPKSASADPGPACYGRGGTGATLTDANLVLGYLDAGFFLGGAMRLDRKAAEAAIRDAVAKPLKLSLARAAWGIHEVINEDVARAFRIHASERGFDYRGASMVAFGGSGPVHAMAIARKLKIPRVVFPVGAGVMSALGLLASPLSFEVARSRRVHVADLDAAAFADEFGRLVAEASGFLTRAGVAEGDIRVTLRLDMRYQGQGHDIEVTLPQAGDFGKGGLAALFADLPRLFGAAYAETYLVSFLEEPIEIINWKVEAAGPAPDFTSGYSLGDPPSGDAKAALKGRRRVYLGEVGDYVEVPVYDRYKLAPGTRIAGPCVVEERESTCIVGKGDRAEVDWHYNLVAELAR